MDLTNPAQVDTLVQALSALADRINDDVNALGAGRRDRAEAKRLILHRDDLNRIVGQLDDGGRDGYEDTDEDTDDVTDPVRDLARYLGRLCPGFPPVHPFAGRGPAGHCWVCAAVGHVVAHPDRGCSDVACDANHVADATGSPDAAVAPPWTTMWVPPGMPAPAGQPRNF